MSPSVNVLILVPLRPAGLLESWKASLPSNWTLVYRPDPADLPTEEELAEADAFFMFQWPSNL